MTVCLSHVPAQHEFGVLGDILLDQVLQQSLHDLGEILQFVVQGHGEQTGNVAPVSLGETLLGLQSVDELRDGGTERQRAQTVTSGVQVSPDPEPTYNSVT